MTAFIFSDGRSVGIFRTVDLTVWTVRVMAVRKGLKRNLSNTVEQFISDILSAFYENQTKTWRVWRDRIFPTVWFTRLSTMIGKERRPFPFNLRGQM